MDSTIILCVTEIIIVMYDLYSQCFSLESINYFFTESEAKSIPIVTHRELDSLILRKNSLTIDGDVRVMDLNVINWKETNGVCCLAACSDGYLRSENSLSSHNLCNKHILRHNLM